MKRRLIILLSSLVMCLKFSVVILESSDRLQNLHNRKTLTISDGVKIEVERLADSVNKTSYFSSHMLRVFLDNVGISFTKAKSKDGLQIGLFTPSVRTGFQARGAAHAFSVILPLLIGFKIAGSIILTLIAVIIVSLKAFLGSVLALLLTAVAVIRKMTMSHDIPVDHHPMQYYGHHSSPGYDSYPSAHGYHAAPQDDPPHSASHDHGPPDSTHHDFNDHHHDFNDHHHDSDYYHHNSDDHNHDFDDQSHDHEEHSHEHEEFTGPSAPAESIVNAHYTTKNANTSSKYKGHKKTAHRKKNQRMPILKITRREDV